MRIRFGVWNSVCNAGGAIFLTPVRYEKRPRISCGNCGRLQFVKKNQLHREEGNAARITWFLCKYCGESQAVTAERK